MTTLIHFQELLWKGVAPMAKLARRGAVPALILVGNSSRSSEQCSQPQCSTVGSTSVRSDSLWLLASHLINGVCQWSTVWFLSLYAGREVLGEFSLANAVVTPLMLFAGLDLRTLQATDQTGKYHTANILLLKVCGVGIAFLGLVCFGLFQKRLDISIALLLGLAAARGWEMISDVAHGCFQKAHRGDVLAKSRVLRATVMLGFLAIVFLASRSIAVTALFLALCSAVLTLVVDFPLAAAVSGADRESLCKGGVAASRSSEMLGLLVTSLPVGATFALISFNAYLPRYWLGYNGGAEAVGSFAVCSAFPMAMIGVSNATTAAALPRLSRFWDTGNNVRGRQLSLNLLLVNGLIGLVSATGLAAFANPLLAVFGLPTGSEVTLFRLLAVSIGVRSLSFGFSTYVRSHKAFSSLLYCEVVAIVALGGALSFANPGSLQHVGWASVFSAIAATVAYACAAGFYWLRPLEEHAK